MRKKKVVRVIEHKTFIKGRFTGKYWSSDRSISLSNENLSYARININEGVLESPEVISEIEYEDYPFNIDDINGFFQNLRVEKISEFKEFAFYDINLRGPKISNVVVSEVQEDGDQSFGCINCEVFGYVSEEETVEEWIVVEEPLKEKPKPVSKNKVKPKYKPRRRRSPYKGSWSGYNAGCADIGAYIALGLCALTAFAVAMSIGPVAVAIFLFMIIRWLVLLYLPKFGGVITSFLKSFFRLLIPVIGLFLLTIVVATLFSVFKDGWKTERSPVPITRDDRERSTIEFEHDSHDSIIIHHRVWEDYSREEREMDIKIFKNDFNQSNVDRLLVDYSITNYGGWPELYDKLEKMDHGRLQMVIDELVGIRDREKLDARSFLEVIGTFIQDIPYALILEGDCDIKNYSEPAIVDVLKYCPECCQGKVKYGVNSPVQFLGSLKGDCDTRTLLAHYILSELGYDVVILNSSLYKHSMLGIDQPYRGGSFKTWLGKQYYFWELTATGFKPGQLPPRIGNIDKWIVEIN